MTALNKQALLIENGQLVADTLRHLADNEIDSDYFAIVSESENGTEIEHELAITDYALQASGTVDELVRALEAAEKRIAEQREYYEGVIADGSRRIAELEARTVTLPVTVDVHPLAPYEAKIFCEFKKNIVQECADAIRAAGIGVKGG